MQVLKTSGLFIGEVDYEMCFVGNSFDITPKMLFTNVAFDNSVENTVPRLPSYTCKSKLGTFKIRDTIAGLVQTTGIVMDLGSDGFDKVMKEALWDQVEWFGPAFVFKVNERRGTAHNIFEADGNWA